MTEALKQTLADGLTGLGLSPTQGQIDQLALYCDRLLEKNQVMNLTAITDPADVVTLHFLDSAALLASRDFGGKKIIDVGQGNGYGTAALQVVIQYFKEHGANNIRLSTKETNTTALSMYRKAGFRDTGEMNEEEIVLELHL